MRLIWILYFVMCKNVRNCEIISNILKVIYGKKKVEILEYMIKNCDENLFFRGTYKEIMESIDVSKPTIVALFSTLRKYHLLHKEKNGLYRLNKKILPKEK